MNKISDIQYKIVKKDGDIGNSKLVVNIKGDSINYIIVNTIRRYILTNIPIYAFSKFNFSVNESIFNNNYLKLRLNNMPIWGILNNIDKYVVKNDNKEEVLNNEGINEALVEDDIDVEENVKLNSSTLNQLTMYINYKSKEKEVTVTTNDAKFYYGEKNIQSPYKIPIPIVKLQPNQNINFSAITDLGIEKINSIYSAVSVCFYKEINNNEYEFVVESRGQITEQRIIEVALINIINDMEKLIKLIPENQTSNIGEIIIYENPNTIGNLISYGLQNHKKVKFAGYNVPHLLEDKVIINYELINEKINIKDVFTEVIDYLLEIFKKIKKLNNQK
jgi:DNA-directed RNA polymerase subunit L